MIKNQLRDRLVLSHTIKSSPNHCFKILSYQIIWTWIHFYFILFYVLTVWQTTVWLHLRDWCGGLHGDVLPAEHDESDGGLCGLCGQCSGLLSPAHGHSLLHSSLAVLKVSNYLHKSSITLYTCVVCTMNRHYQNLEALDYHVQRKI